MVLTHYTVSACDSRPKHNIRNIKLGEVGFLVLRLDNGRRKAAYRYPAVSAAFTRAKLQEAGHDPLGSHDTNHAQISAYMYKTLNKELLSGRVTPEQHQNISIAFLIQQKSELLHCYTFATYFRNEIFGRIEPGCSPLKMAHPRGFEPLTFASGVQSHQSALYGSPSTNPLKSLNRHIKAFVIIEIKLA